MRRLLQAAIAVALLAAVTYALVPASFFTLTALYVIAGLIFVYRARRRDRRKMPPT